MYTLDATYILRYASVRVNGCWPPISILGFSFPFSVYVYMKQKSSIHPTHPSAAVYVTRSITAAAGPESLFVPSPVLFQYRNTQIFNEEDCSAANFTSWAGRVYIPLVFSDRSERFKNFGPFLSTVGSDGWRCDQASPSISLGLPDNCFTPAL